MRTIALITDEPVLAGGFRSFLAGSDNLLLEPISFDPAELEQRVDRMQPDVVLLDWDREWSLGVIAKFCSDLPHLTIILVARNPSPELLYQAQEAGLSGLLDTRSSRAGILSMLEHCEHEQFAFDTQSAEQGWLWLG